MAVTLLGITGVVAGIAGILLMFGWFAGEINRILGLTGIVLLIAGIFITVYAVDLHFENFRQECEAAGGYILGDKCYGFGRHK